MKKLMPIALLIVTACATAKVAPVLETKAVAEPKKLPAQMKFVELDQVRLNQTCPTDNKLWPLKTEQEKIHLANTCLVKQKWTKLEEISLDISQKNPDSPWGPYYLSFVAESAAQLEKASWMVDLALKKNSGVGILYYQKGRILWMLKDYSMAYEAFKKSIELKTYLLSSYEFLGSIELRNQDYKKAAGYFEAVLNVQNRNEIALSGMAQIAMVKKDASAAMNYLRKLVEMKPKSYVYHLEYAKLLEGEADYEAALLEYRLAKTLVSTNTQNPEVVTEKIGVLAALVRSQQEKKQQETAKVSKREPAQEKDKQVLKK